MRLRVRATSRSFNILCPAAIKPERLRNSALSVWSHLEPIYELGTRTGGTGHICWAC